MRVCGEIDGGGMADNQLSDRILVLSKRDTSKNTVTDSGLIDNRLFTGGNKLHAVMEPNGLWSLHYDAGIVPPAMRQQFTTFSQVMKFLKQYFYKRNIEIKEVID